MYVVWSLLFLAVSTDGHGYLSTPMTRAGLNPNDSVKKLTPFASATATANALDCGASVGNPSTPGAPIATYAPGSDVVVTFNIGLPHPDATPPSGNSLRVAVHYSDADSFAQNVIWESDPATVETMMSGGDHSVTVTLPATKTSDTAVLQWLWASEGDGGFYLSCADVKLGAAATAFTVNVDGEAKTFASMETLGPVEVYWNRAGDTVEIAAKHAATSWLAFGLTSGGMAGAEAVLGWTNGAANSNVQLLKTNGKAQAGFTTPATLALLPGLTTPTVSLDGTDAVLSFSASIPEGGAHTVVWAVGPRPAAAGTAITKHDDKATQAFSFPSPSEPPAEGTEFITATATFDSSSLLEGTLTLTQEKDKPLSATSLSLVASYRDVATVDTVDHLWHLHVNKIGTDSASSVALADRCLSAGAHLDKPAKEAGECSMTAPNSCENGDLSGRLGTVSVDGVKQTWTDMRLPLSGANSVVGGSFVIHAENKATERIACANIIAGYSVDMGDRTINFAKSKLLSNSVSLFWTQTGSRVQVAAQTSGPAWVAVGFSPKTTAPFMATSEVVMGWASASDAANKATHFKKLAGTDFGSFGDSSSGVMKLVAGSAEVHATASGAVNLVFSVDIPAGTKPTLVWAIGGLPASATASPSIHSSKAAELQFDFATGQAVTPIDTTTPAKNAHAVMMILSWGILIPAAVMMARFGKPLGSAWFMVHRVVNCVALLLFFIAFFLALGAFATGYYTGHAVFGGTVFALGILQPLGGFLRPHNPSDGEEKSMKRKIWEVAHKWMGRVAIVLAYLNIWIGLDILKPAGGWVFVVVAIQLAMFGIFMGFTIKQLMGGSDKKSTGV